MRARLRPRDRRSRGPRTRASRRCLRRPRTGITAGVDRIQRDVLAQPNVKTVVIYLGGIDIRSAECHAAPDVEAALTQMTAAAYAANVRVILATVPPAAYCPNTAAANYGPVPSAAAPYAGDVNPGPENPGSAQRRALNDWIRTFGSALPGVVGIADFDKALASPDHPNFMIPNLNSGDNFHPNGTGYEIQSASIPIAAIGTFLSWPRSTRRAIAIHRAPHATNRWMRFGLSREGAASRRRHLAPRATHGHSPHRRRVRGSHCTPRDSPRRAGGRRTRGGCS